MLSDTTIVTSSTSGAGLGRFPGEVSDYIIDFLHHEVDSLKTCALVSSAWTPCAHFHLFQTVTCNPDQPGRTVADIVAWMSSDDGTRVSQYVTTLVIQPSKIALVPSSRVSTPEIILLMTRMPNVGQMTLKNVVIHDNDPVSATQHAASRSYEALYGTIIAQNIAPAGA